MQIICPYCKGEMSDYWEALDGSQVDEKQETECGWCEKTFYVRFHLTVSISKTGDPYS